MNLKISLNWGIAVVVIAIVGAYVGYYLFLLSGYSGPDHVGDLAGVRSGTFGDAFGVLNALFSGLAFSGVLITLLLQRKDLAGSQIQNAKQQAESQFYNMLNLQQQVIQGFDLHRLVPNAQHTIQGRDCFRDWGIKLSTRHAELAGKYSHECSLERALEAYEKVLKKHQGDLGLYFRSLYSVFRFIEGSDCIDKRNAGLVVRSLLSDFELTMLFYNCLSERGRKFKRFAIAYALFDNLDVELLITGQHVLFIEKQAFGDNEEALNIFKRQDPFQAAG